MSNASLSQFLIDVTRGPLASSFNEDAERVVAASGLDEDLRRALVGHDLAGLWRAGAHPMALLYFSRKIGWDGPRYYRCISAAHGSESSGSSN